MASSGTTAQGTTTLKVTTPAPRDAWVDVVAGTASVVPSQTPAWLDAACAHGPWEDASRLYETPDGRALILPMVRRRNLPRAVTSEHSMPPNWNTGGLVSADPVPAEDFAAVVADLTAGRALTTTVRPDFEQAPRWAAAARAAGAREIPHLHHVLDLHGDFDQVWAGFSKMARKAIRKAEKEHVTVEQCHGEAAVRAFYRLHLAWLDHRARTGGVPLPIARRLSRGRESLPRLLTLSDALGKAFTVWIARLDGVAIAAMITLIEGEVALAWQAASERQVADGVRAMDLLHRHAIEFATLRGCRYYNMGESSGVESLMRFKTRFGATPREFAGYRFERLPVSAITGPMAALRRRAEHAALEAATRFLGRKGAAAGAPADS